MAVRIIIKPSNFRVPNAPTTWDVLVDGIMVKEGMSVRDALDYSDEQELQLRLQQERASA